MRLTPVVTRYGGHTHLGVREERDNDRHYTLCLGTSAWTLASWARVNDHPTLTFGMIQTLPECPKCLVLAGMDSATEQQPARTTFLWKMLLDYLCVAITVCAGISLVTTGLWFVGVVVIAIGVAATVVSIRDDIEHAPVR